MESRRHPDRKGANGVSCWVTVVAPLPATPGGFRGPGPTMSTYTPPMFSGRHIVVADEDPKVVEPPVTGSQPM